MASAFDLLPIILASQQADAARQAAAAQEQRQREQFDYFKKQNEDDRAASAPILQGIRDTLEANQKAAAEDRARYKATFQPIEDQLVADARSYASPERKMLEIGKATSLVSNQMEGQRRSAARNLESFGIDPGAVRYAGLDANMRALTGAAQAAAGTQADQNVDNTARQLRAQAISVGQGYPGQIAQAYQTGTNAGNSGLQGITNLTGMAANTLGTPVQYGSLASNYMSNANQALGLMNQGYGSYYNQQNASGGSGWGSMLGFLGGSLLSNRGLFSGGSGAATGAATGAAGAAASPGLWSSLSSAASSAIPYAMSALAMLEEGGTIPSHTSPTGGAAIDDVPARLTVGEFVVPKDVASWKGEEFFQKLIEQSRKAKQGAVAKPEIGVAPQEPPTFISRPQGGALPVG
jgi:hypothetical protein